MKAAAVLLESEHVRGMPYGLTCDDCPRGSTLGAAKCYTFGDDSTGYHFEKKKIVGLEWDVCPSIYLNDYRTHNLMGYFAAGYGDGSYRLDGWPDKFAAWVEMGLVELRTRVNKKRNLKWEERAQR